MKKYTLAGWLFALSAILFLLHVFQTTVRQEPHTTVLGVETTTPKVYAEYEFNWEALEDAVANTPEKITTESKIKAAVAPHHLVAADYISDVYARLADQDVQRVILVGPNHYEVGNYWALTSTASWQVRDATVVVDTDIVAQLEHEQVVRSEEDFMEKEHAMSAHIPFIAHYLPDAEIVPIMVSGYTSRDDIKKLAAAIDPLLDETTAVVGSVDFSHYLPSIAAQEHDNYTRTLLEDWSSEEIFSLSETADYMDSSATIVLLQDLFAQQDTNLHILRNTNSGIIMGDDTIPTTSYFEILYTQK